MNPPLIEPDPSSRRKVGRKKAHGKLLVGLEAWSLSENSVDREGRKKKKKEKERKEQHLFAMSAERVPLCSALEEIQLAF